MIVSDDRLENAIRIAARVVDLYGEKYWPVFERLEAELEARQSRKARLRAHLPGRPGNAEDPPMDPPHPDRNRSLH